MITKSKTAPRPKSQAELAGPPRRKVVDRPTPVPEMCKLHSAEEITLAEREAAFYEIETAEPLLVMSCQNLGDVEIAADLIKVQLFINHVGQWKREQPGTGELTAVRDGVLVTAEDRRGVLTWLEIAEYFRDTQDESDDEDDVEPLDVNKAIEAHDKLGAAAVGPAKQPRAKKQASPTSTVTPAGIREHAADVIVEPVHGAILPTKLIDTSANNPRKSFDASYIDGLAQSIREHGQLQAIVVRPMGDRFEVVCGECRLRAIKQNGRHEVLADILTLTDQQADELRLIENLNRKDLDVIDEAGGYRDLIQRYQLTHKQLAARVGMSEAHITQRVGLLALPEVWLDKLRTRVISATHARELMPWTDWPDVLTTVAAKLFKKNGQWCGAWGNDADGVPGHSDFRAQVHCVIRNHCGHRVDEAIYPKNSFKNLGKLKLTAEQRTELAIIKVGDEEIATNKAAFERLKRAHIKANYTPPSITPSKAKARKEPSVGKTAAKRTKAAELLATRLREDWLPAWQAWELAAQVGANPLYASEAALLFLVESEDVPDSSTIYKALRVQGKTTVDRIAAMLKMQVDEALAKAAPLIFWNPVQKRRQGCLPLDCFPALIAAWRIDLASAWREDLAGPCSAAFWALHEDWQLDELGDEYELDVRGFKGTKAKIAFLTKNRAFRAKLPASIAAAMAPAPKKAKAKR